MNSKNSGTFNPDRQLFNLRDKIKLKGNVTYASLSNLGIYYEWKNIKNSSKSKFKI